MPPVMPSSLLELAVEAAPDPELARTALARLEERPHAAELLARPDVASGAALLLGLSRAATDFFSVHPEELEALADLRPRSLEELCREAAEASSALGTAGGLRRFRRRAGYRVAVRDLRGASVDDVTAELTAVAEACLRVAVPSHVNGVPLAVIGMGKLGGSELNYASDVDVLFVHAEGGPEAQLAASQAAAVAIALLTEPTVDGVALRVDPDLRPEGRAGPLSRSILSMGDYYGRHAATWERQSLLKARPVAGDLALGRAFLESVRSVVYPAVLPAAAIEDVRATKVRIEEHVRAAGKDAVELKRGRGGIRDVEFAVQLLQLVHGGRHVRLREPGTLPALAALADEGFVAASDAEALGRSYRFLRRLEHRLQMVRDLQTHQLPGDRGSLETLARAMALPDADRLRAEHARHTEVVRGLHERLFYRPLLEAFTAGPARPVDRSGTEELLAGLGFADPPAARRALERMVDPGTRLGKVLGGLFPVIAPPLAFAPLPDVALARFERAMAGLTEDERLADRLADRPDAARRMSALLAASSAFADALAASPTLIRSVFEPPPRERQLFPGDHLPALVRVAGAFAAGDLDVPELGRHLAAVADGVVAEALQAAAPGVPMAVIGLGKLGGEELSFASDLDVVFVYEGDGSGDFEEAARAAERSLELVRAAGWEADADLRPEGRSGPLARSLASYLEYWQRWAETWEYQSLLRSRLVAGDEALGRRFLSNARDVGYPESMTQGRVVAVRRMRVRMEEERIRSVEARRFHFKLGYGSLADVQFAAELSLMRHGHEHPEVRHTHTLDALEALAAAGLLEASVAGSLADAYVFLTRIKAWMELDRRVPQGALPPTPEAQAVLARRLGYGEAARHRFLQEYRAITRRARLAMERVFYGEDG